MTEETNDPLLGRALDGRYRIEGRLGEGGLGVVYRARHLRLDRAFAIKVLQPSYAQNAQLRARFEREAKALGALNHPGVVAVTDFGIDGEVPYLVMELLEGATLDARMPLPPERALAVLRDVLGAVAYAHGLGLVHRDLKPANIFLEALPDEGERVRVLDFGLAKFLDGGDGSALTRPGATLGTPAYMSPEQALGGAASARNDVYSLGILLYELLTGERPFVGEGGELMRQHLLVPIPSLLERPHLANISVTGGLPALDVIVRRAAAKSPVDRYADASEMRAALDAALGRNSGPHPALKPTASATQKDVSPKASSGSAGSEGKRVDEAAATMLAGETVQDFVQSRPGEERAPELPSAGVGARVSEPRPSGLIAPDAAATAESSGGRLPKTRPQLEPVKNSVKGEAKRPAKSGGSGLSWLLLLVLITAGFGGALYLPRLLGLDYDPIAALRASEAVRSVDLGELPEIPEIPEITLPEIPGLNTEGAAAEVDAGEPTPRVEEGTATGETSEAPAGFGARDPWLEPVPPELEQFRARVAAGEPLGDGARASLRLFARDHDGDPRPWLLIGHAFYATGARTTAMDRYELAMETSTSARYDPQMLDNLVVMSAHHTVGERARGLVRTIYGPDALPALRRIRVSREDTEEIERLDALEEALLGATP